MIETEFVVVGSGGAALTAAVLAARAGLDTVVLERTDRVGGTSAYSGGACWLPADPDPAREYLDHVLENPDRARVEAFLTHAPELVAALAEAGIDFEPVVFPEYYDAPGRAPGGRSIQPTAITRDALSPEVAALVRPPVERDRAGRGGRRTLTGGQALIARLLTLLHDAGGRVLTGHQVTELLTEGGRVTGVVARTGLGFHDHGGVEVVARRGVLLAAGGFEGNQAARSANGVPGRAEWSMAPAGTNTGEVIDAARAVGAAVTGLDWAWLCPGLLQPDGRAAFTLGFRGGVMVDANGHRYGDESLPYDRFGQLMAQDPARERSWLVFDSRTEGALPALPVPDGDPAAWVHADTLEELAGAIGVDAATLTATVERFNGLAADGKDTDFGRGEDEYEQYFGFGLPVLVPVDTPPYTAARFVLSDLGTKGGLVTDTSGRVLREDGAAIEGLYAAGNTAANLAGNRYPAPGVPLGTGMVAASLAVRDLVGKP